MTLNFAQQAFIAALVSGGLATIISFFQIKNVRLVPAPPICIVSQPAPLLPFQHLLYNLNPKLRNCTVRSGRVIKTNNGAFSELAPPLLLYTGFCSWCPSTALSPFAAWFFVAKRWA